MLRSQKMERRWSLCCLYLWKVICQNTCRSLAKAELQVFCLLSGQMTEFFIARTSCTNWVIFGRHWTLIALAASVVQILLDDQSLSCTTFRNHCLFFVFWYAGNSQFMQVVFSALHKFHKGSPSTICATNPLCACKQLVNGKVGKLLVIWMTS